MISMTYTADPARSSRVYRGMLRAVLVCALVACGGGSKKAPTTPTGGGSGASSTGDQSMKDTPAPDMNGGGGNTGGGGGPANTGGGGDTGGSGNSAANEPAVSYPNYDPDPAQAKAQVDQHLNVAKQALSAPTPDADTALREARAALAIDAANLDAAAYVAFALYHKKQYDSAELVLDDVFKRPAAKENATIYYVYGLVYDHTNRPEQAVLAFQKAVSLNPNFSSALVDLGVHQLENKQYTEAQATFEKLTRELGRNDAVTLTSLASAYRGRSGDYPPGSGERNNYLIQAEVAYKKALAANPNYGPAYYDLALLYLDGDPFPSAGGTLDTTSRLNAAKAYLDQYKNMPGVDMKLYDTRAKDVDKAIKREQKRQKKAGKSGGGASGGGTP
jgi:tetratricopeptide (TPR) repeat protein